jgi:hypothetical protein
MTVPNSGKILIYGGATDGEKRKCYTTEKHETHDDQLYFIL